MLISGLYLLLKSIRVDWGYGLWRVGGVPVTSGNLLLLFLLGVGILFFNGRNPLGWLLSAGSVICLCIGVIADVRFSLQGMSAFDLLLILGLIGAGAGLLFGSLRQV
jgi:ABC-type Na+ efflux pump permease subunit